MSDWRQTFPWSASVLRFLWPDGPARRKRWLKIATIGVVLVALHAALTAVMATRTSRVAERFVEQWGPLDPSAYRPPSVNDEDNQARAVRAAAEILVLPQYGVGTRRIHEDYASGTEGILSAADRDSIRKVAADNAMVFSLLDLAVARPNSNWDLDYKRGVAMDIPPLLKIIQLAKLNVATGRLALEDGRVDEALAAIRRGTALAASLSEEPVLIVQLVRQAVARLDAGLVRRILATGDLTPEQRGVLRHAFADANPRLAIQRALIAETASLEGVMQGHLDGPTDAWQNPRVPSLVGIGIVRTLARPYLLNEERLWLTMMSAKIAELGSERHARTPAPLRPTLRWWNVVVRLIESDHTDLVERADLAEARILLARTAITIEDHRQVTGQPPGTLADLVPHGLPALPVDPLTGRPFRYETNGMAWRVWSEGDLSGMDSPRRIDAVLDWARP